MSVYVIPLAAVRLALTECACLLALGVCLKGVRVPQSVALGFQSGFVCNTRTFCNGLHSGV